MRIGSLRHRVTVQAGGEVQNPETGELSQGWVDEAAGIPAAIEPVSGREFVAAAALQTRVTTRITIRYRGEMTSKKRLVDEMGKVYGIEAVLPDRKSGLEYQTLMCTEGEDA